MMTPRAAPRAGLGERAAAGAAARKNSLKFLYVGITRLHSVARQKPPRDDSHFLQTRVQPPFCTHERPLSVRLITRKRVLVL